MFLTPLTIATDEVHSRPRIVTAHRVDVTRLRKEEIAVVGYIDSAGELHRDAAAGYTVNTYDDILVVLDDESEAASTVQGLREYAATVGQQVL
jgi:hypothetical protein